MDNFSTSKDLGVLSTDPLLCLKLIHLYVKNCIHDIYAGYIIYYTKTVNR
jgi:hypothetical protein